MESNHHSDSPDLKQLLLQLDDRLSRIEQSLSLHGEPQFLREWYTIAETAAILERAPFTVREWARLGRIHAMKRPSGRGKASEWIVAHGEIERIKNKGLLPPNF